MVSSPTEINFTLEQAMKGLMRRRGRPIALLFL